MKKIRFGFASFAISILFVNFIGSMAYASSPKPGSPLSHKSAAPSQSPNSISAPIPFTSTNAEYLTSDLDNLGMEIITELGDYTNLGYLPKTNDLFVSLKYIKGTKYNLTLNLSRNAKYRISKAKSKTVNLAPGATVSSSGHSSGEGKISVCFALSNYGLTRVEVISLDTTASSGLSVKDYPIDYRACFRDGTAQLYK
jgi:hypothetical protein